MLKLKKIGVFLIPVAVLLVIFSALFIAPYNSLVNEEAEVENSWANVDTVLQRRYDLIPNLVNSVKANMAQEEDIFLGIAKSRENYNKATTTEEKANASEELSANIGTVLNVIQEDYPELSSNTNVQDLMTQLEGTENRIAVARNKYNGHVTKYNKSIRQFPKSLIANMFGFDKKELFKANENASTAPSVDFE